MGLELKNGSYTIHESAARTAAPTNVDQHNEACSGVHVIVDYTARAAATTLTVTVEGKDPASGKYYTLLQSAALALATTVLKVFPGATPAANLAANDILPRTWRVIVTPSDGNSATYSVGASLVVGA